MAKTAQQYDEEATLMHKAAEIARSHGFPKLAEDVEDVGHMAVVMRNDLASARDRALWKATHFEVALEAFAVADGHSMDHIEDGDELDWAKNLVTALLHFCDVRKHDFDDIVATAYEWYAEDKSSD